MKQKMMDRLPMLVVIGGKSYRLHKEVVDYMDKMHKENKMLKSYRKHTYILYRAWLQIMYWKARWRSKKVLKKTKRVATPASVPTRPR